MSDFENLKKRAEEPVSYTHLDVYKRQESRRVVSNRKAQEFFDSLDYENLKLKAVAAENDFEREYPRRLPDGRIIWVRSTLHLLVDPATNHLMLFIYMKAVSYTHLFGAYGFRGSERPP